VSLLGRRNRARQGRSHRIQSTKPVRSRITAEHPLKTFPGTDLGNARRLVDAHGRDLRYCISWGKWLIWDGKRWAVDRTGEIERRAKSTVDGMKREAKSMDEEDQRRTALQKHCRLSQSASRLQAMCRVAESELAVVVTPEELDRDPFLLNCGNGTLDLQTGQLRKHRREDLLTKITPIECLETATCPTFETFLNRITGGDTELAMYLQRCIGYCLTGQVTEKALFFLCGGGDNGKTTFIEAVRFVLGEYAGQVPIETFLRKNNNGIPNDLAQLDKLRFVTSSEVPEGRSLDESKVKYMTGMGTIQARYLYHELFEFKPTFKLLIDTNRLPRVAGDEKAVWNRVHVIPFNVTIADSEKDKNLLARLQAEAPGILNWAVRGCLDWRGNALRVPDAVQKASQGYREEADTVARFLAECCEIRKGFEKTADLYSAYIKWCSEEGERPEEKVRLAKVLASRGDLQQQKVKGDRGWLGIKLNEGYHTPNALRGA